jgi:hypothetical protein
MMSPNNTYAGVRTASGMKLVVFDELAEPGAGAGGAAAAAAAAGGNLTEMYNITRDSAEMVNIAATDPAGSSAARRKLQQRLDHLRVCKEDSCRD